MNDHEIVRAMIESENERIHQRMSWTTAMNALFLAAASGLWDKHHAKPLLVLVAILAMGGSALSGLAVLFAHRAVRVQFAWWDRIRPDDWDGPDVIGLRPIGGRWSVWISAYTLVPAMFVAGWLVFLTLLWRI